MDKYQDKYRIQSARMQKWDYRWSAAYFITLSTQNRKHYFGEIIPARGMQLSPVGIIADILWYEIKNHTSNVELGAFVVMPNHIHGILILKGNDGNRDGNDNDNGNDTNTVETGHAVSLQSRKITGKNRFQNIGKNSVSSIVGSYKSAVTRHANQLGYPFGWQTRFYDHIIRDDQSFQRISDYIMNNAGNWVNDNFNNDQGN